MKKRVALKIPERVENLRIEGTIGRSWILRKTQVVHKTRQEGSLPATTTPGPQLLERDLLRTEARASDMTFSLWSSPGPSA